MSLRTPSLQSRLLATLAVLLLLAAGIAAVGLDSLYRDLGLRARQDVLDAQIIALIATAEPDDAGRLIPDGLAEARLSNPGSGLFAEIHAPGNTAGWRSPSTLGSGLALAALPEPGERITEQTTLPDGTRILALSLGVRWSDEAGERNFVFRAAESLEPFHAEVRKVRAALAVGALLISALLLLGLAIALHQALQPLRRLESEISEAEAGERELLGAHWPRELAGVTGNLNALLAGERKRLDRSRITLGNLAHSLKTPLAALHSQLEQLPANERQQLLPLLARMQTIVQHQLKRAVFGGGGATLADMQLAEPLQQLRGALLKVYADRQVECTLHLAPGVAYPVEAADFLELAGNLMDNAFKYCRSRVEVRAMPWTSAEWRRPGLLLDVEDDGHGIAAHERARVLERGVRVDESVDGQGIGLSVGRDIAAGLSGSLDIGASPLGGARISVRLPGR